MRRLIIFSFLLSACNGEIRNDSVAGETKPTRDTTSCSAAVGNELVLGDTTLVFPKINLNNTSASAKINRLLTVQRLSSYSLDELKENKEKYKTDSMLFGLTAAGYEITYNENCLLSIVINMETMGAYPSGFSAYRNFDLNTGDSVYLEKLLDETKINDLVKLCDDTLQRRIERCKKEYADQDFIIEQLIDKKFTRANLTDFYITATEVVLVYSFGFPHVIQGAEPDGLLKIKREDFRKYLKVNPFKI
ncbi:MAG: hypothetical protein ACXVPN_13455 [Bacteroidia bacterium]